MRPSVPLWCQGWQQRPPAALESITSLSWPVCSGRFEITGLGPLRRAVVVHGNMYRACEAAGIAHFHPHDLRHRYASVKIGEGVPVTQVAAQLGHSRNSLTLDTYSHVIVR